MVSSRDSGTVGKAGSGLRLAIAGIGLVGQRHADALDHVAGATLCAIVDPSDMGKAEAAARNVPWYGELESMIRAEAPDGIILSTPTKLHVAQGLACVESGVPVLIEKPLADDIDAARVLIDRAEKAGVAILVGHHRRHNPIIRKALELIREGHVGTVRAVQATCWFYKPDGYFDVAPWRKKTGAGPISVNLVHDIDLLRHLCGEVVSVQAQAAPSARGFENEDVGVALLRFESGALGTITVSDSIVSPWSWEMTSQEYPVYPATSQSAYQIGGSHGSLSIPDLTLWSHGAQRDWWSPISATSMPRGASDPLINQMAHFVAVIEGREAPVVSGREGLRSLAVVGAIQDAARTRETIHLVSEAVEAARTGAEGLRDRKGHFENPVQ
ncbi:Gfo/Idh/MocA family protein [Shimia aestuarii]|uniref:Predicted dehydrogenase n=1 Tax=Shimia aestuarii TaxID=254406 RepID=A0A1I4H9P0_9RHOB|nr:Gfo/Idh/MocA family oxidoreductase [Shimia aestuarii]SFL38954.1 Predicted dehydrogenase [Shimia aestuarii]